MSYQLRYDDALRQCLYTPRTPEKPPPGWQGERVTGQLSGNAVRVIKGASVKAALLGTPIQAMWTFTLSPRVTLKDGRELDARRAVAAGHLVLSHEMRRVLTAIRNGLVRKGYDQPFEYIWVAENPGSKASGHDWLAGTRNPHVHLLTTFRVGYKDFRSFAAWIESLWGLGMVHLELIRKPFGAAFYLLKCIGYVSKGATATVDEPIKGQRWACSRGIRPQQDLIEGIEFDPVVERRLRELLWSCRRNGNQKHGWRLAVTPYCLLGQGDLRTGRDRDGVASVGPDALEERFSRSAIDFVKLVSVLVENELVRPAVLEGLELAMAPDEEQDLRAAELPDGWMFAWGPDEEIDTLGLVDACWDPDEEPAWACDPLL